jgi:hypothetical protein
MHTTVETNCGFDVIIVVSANRDRTEFCGKSGLMFPGPR